MRNYDVPMKAVTQGIITADQQRRQQHAAIMRKWESTGLLNGIKDNQLKESVGQLLENQAAQVLKEQSAIGTGLGADSGTLRGFSNIAFPMVRRVFAGLLANELVSLQSMALPSGLLFYLDYTYGNNVGFNAYNKDKSIFGDPLGAKVRAGADGTGGMYDYRMGFSSPWEYNVFKVSHTGTLVTGSATAVGELPFAALVGDPRLEALANVGSLRYAILDLSSGSYGRRLQANSDPLSTPGAANRFIAAPSGWSGLTAGDTQGIITQLAATDPGTFTPSSRSQQTRGDLTKYTELSISGSTDVTQYRRWTSLFGASASATAAAIVGNPVTEADIEESVNFTIGSDHVYALVVFADSTNADPGVATLNGTPVLSASYPIRATVTVDADGQTVTVPTFESDFRKGSANGMPTPEIPEIDIRIESIAVTASTRKLRARWSPELAQDLNAYHTLDAEVELTSVLSEQIALEVDREILNDLLTGASAAVFYWSRLNGKFVDKLTGAELTRSSSLAPGPGQFGTQREWYETLIETVIDVSNEIHRKTLRGAGNFLVTSPAVSTMLEASNYYRPNYSIDGAGQVSNPMQIGVEPLGSVANRFVVYKDPYFVPNQILVGFKGKNWLETGYVYAPYVPLIITPTLYDTEDFTPRKGVMTRYGKKMLRADFYGRVHVLDMNVF
jgi:hypothetical protein